MISELGDIFCRHMHFCHGASAISGRKKRFNSVEDALLVIIAIITLTGFKPLSLAVRVMVMIIEALRFSRSFLLPKDIFLNKTAFLMPCSAALFVGSIAGYLRNTSSSSLNLISRLRCCQCSMLIMNKNSIFKQFFSVHKECFCFRCKGFVFEQISDVPQQMDKAFLFAKSFDFAKVRTPEIAYNDTIVVFTEVVNNNFETSALVNMKESNIRVGENPEPVTLPAGFVNMYKWKFGQRLFQTFVYRSSLFSKLMVKSDQRTRYYFQAAQALQYMQRTVIGSLSLITDKGGFSSGIRPDKSVGNFLITPAVDDAFANDNTSNNSEQSKWK